MKLENQVTSLEISKRLKELGVKQESLFSRYLYPVQDDGNATEYLVLTSKKRNRECNDKVSAFTVAELGEMLPAKINGFDIRYEKIVTEHGFYRWSVTYWEIGREDEQRFEGRYSDIGEADARGKMFIYLLENKLI